MADLVHAQVDRSDHNSQGDEHGDEGEVLIRLLQRERVLLKREGVVFLHAHLQ